MYFDMNVKDKWMLFMSENDVAKFARDVQQSRYCRSDSTYLSHKPHIEWMVLNSLMLK